MCLSLSTTGAFGSTTRTTPVTTSQTAATTPNTYALPTGNAILTTEENDSSAEKRTVELRNIRPAIAYAADALVSVSVW